MSQLRNPLTTRCLNSSKRFQAKCKLWQTGWESELGKGRRGTTSNCSACVLCSQWVTPVDSRQETLQQGWFFNQTVNCLSDLLLVGHKKKTARNEWAIGHLFSRHTTDLSGSLCSLSLSLILCSTSQNKMPPQAKLLIISHSAFAKMKTESASEVLPRFDSSAAAH